MPTFEELFHVNLSPLQSAADDWAAMAVLLNKVAKEAGSMRRLAQGTEWKGENASVTKPFVVRVSDEFTDAVTEAESVGNLLSSAHDKIKAARDDLKVLCENPPAGITIHADGTLSRSVQPQRMSHGDPESVVTQDDFDALQRRIDAITARAAEADSTCSWGLWQLTKDKREFGSTYYGSLKDASTDVRQAQQTKTDSVEYTPPAKWGSGTIKPIAEFLSYRSWMGGGEAALHGDLNGAIQGAIGGSPSAAGGEASKHLAKGALLSDVRGKHHRPTFINTIGKFGEKIFSVPVSVIATGIDFYYTPNQPRTPGDTHVNAPAEPGKVRYQ
ncbi:hypothetical protein [Streptomyces olivochromogenes]|uniref:Uncharacterized protein n=1 Tax=Streptomyces olivochromogenes TaxID=1963 RepID=A0A250VIH6_STROL|nr:hypothetical protein [Streptomyces olivochromogenes]KUN43297.1 hypothetical protein AQJ27_32545 [Streptomyces olivochromogenes]GAX53997.1 hypothetical protein SO3561_05529 [Streptomyces olivochromogenes]